MENRAHPSSTPKGNDILMIAGNNQKNTFLVCLEDLYEQIVWATSNLEKTPISPRTGSPARWKDKPHEDLVTYSEATLFISDKEGWIPALCLKEEHGLLVVDLDNCFDETGLLYPWAQEIYDQFNSSTYLSRSGKGLHIYGSISTPIDALKTAIPHTKGSSCCVEAYSHDKVMTFTGKPYGVLIPLNDAQEAFAWLEANYRTPREAVKAPIGQSPLMADDEVIALCRKARNAAKFEALYDQGKHPTEDESIADFALCAQLAWYTQDPTQIDRLFRQSKLMRSKWEREDYRNNTIKKAIEGLSSCYRGINPVKDTEEPASNTTEGVWEKPIPLETEGIPDVEFPFETLPGPLKQACAEVARFTKVDPALPALVGIGAFALSIGKKARIHERPGLIHHPSIILMGVAASGERKSATFEIMMRCINNAAEKELGQYKVDKEKVEKHNNTIQGCIKELQTKARQAGIETPKGKEALTKIDVLSARIQTAPVDPWNFGDDLTPQRIFQKLDRHAGAYGIFSPEGRGIADNILGSGQKGGMAGDTVYLAGSWGDDLSRSRVGSGEKSLEGEETRIRKPALTVTFMIQPDKWKELSLDQRLRSSGFISRVLVSNVKSKMGERFEDENEASFDSEQLKTYEQLVVKIRSWKPENPIDIHLSPEAAECRRKWHNSIEAQVGIEGTFADVADIASKAVSLCTRLAGIFHMIDLATVYEDLSKIDQIPKIPMKTWCYAQALMEYHLNQAIQSQREHSPKGTDHLLRRAFNWINRNRKGPPFTAAILARGLGRGLKKEEAEPLCKTLEKLGWIRPVVPSGKIPQYEPNPHMHGVI